LLIDHASGVVIGETCVVGRDCTILQGVTLGGAGGLWSMADPNTPQDGHALTRNMVSLVDSPILPKTTPP